MFRTDQLEREFSLFSPKSPFLPEKNASPVIMTIILIIMRIVITILFLL